MKSKENIWLLKQTSDGLHLFNPVTDINILNPYFPLPAEINKPFQIAIELTKKCSKECDFCYACSAPNGTTSWKKEEVVAFCKSLSKNVFTINLGGGEPFEFPGIVEILNSLKDEPVALSVTTNGLLLEKYLPEIQSNNKLTITVSLHESEEIDFVVHCINLIKSYGFKTSVNVLLRKSKISQLKKVIPKISNLTRMNFLNFKPYGYAKEQSQERFSSEELLAFLKELNFKSACVSSCEPIPGGVKSVYPGCGALKRWLTITSNKRVKPCSFTDIEIPLKNYSYDSLLEAIKSCSVPCNNQRKTNGKDNIEVWLSSNSSHSMDSTFWAITDDSIAKLWTSEMGVLPSWPELDEEELFQELLAETLNSKRAMQRIKNVLESRKINDLKYGCDRTIYVSRKPLKQNPKIVTAIIALPDARFYKHGFQIGGHNKKKTRTQFQGFDVFLIWIYEVIELLAYCYHAISPDLCDIDNYKKGYIDICGNELVYRLQETPQFSLKKLAPKLFKKLSKRLASIEANKEISMAEEDYTVWNDKPIPELVEQEQSVKKRKRKKERSK